MTRGAALAGSLVFLAVAPGTVAGLACRASVPRWLPRAPRRRR
jgi:hypothetical protein